MTQPLRELFAARLSLPLIAAPMFRVSGPELVIAACQAGVIGAFPTANCRSVDEFDQWLTRIGAALSPQHAPFCPNLIMRRAALKDELACLLRHRVELVITSVGAPDPVVAPLHDIGCRVLADVASVRHAEKAIAAGVPVGRVNTRAEVLTDPQVVHNRSLRAVPNGDAGAVRLARGAARFGADDDSAPRPGAHLGEHTLEVLQELGLDAAAIDALLSAVVARAWQPAAR